MIWPLAVRHSRTGPSHRSRGGSGVAAGRDPGNRVAGLRDGAADPEQRSPRAWRGVAAPGCLAHDSVDQSEGGRNSTSEEAPVRTYRLTRNYPVVILACCLSFSVLPIVGAWSAPAADAQGPAAISGLHVVGNQIRHGAGHPVRLLGVNRSGTEYACIQGWGIFDGPADAASLQPIVAWRANAVRVPLNEDCWLAINGVPTAYSGANYQAAIASYVAALNAA